MAAINLGLLFEKKNRRGGVYFEFNDSRASLSTEQENEPKNVSSTDESDVVKPSANFLNVEL